MVLAEPRAPVEATDTIGGLAARRLAWEAVHDVLRRRVALDDVLETRRRGAPGARRGPGARHRHRRVPPSRHDPPRSRRAAEQGPGRRAFVRPSRHRGRAAPLPRRARPRRGRPVRAPRPRRASPAARRRHGQRRLAARRARARRHPRLGRSARGRYARLARGALDGGLRTRTGPRGRRRRTPPRRRSTLR